MMSGIIQVQGNITPIIHLDKMLGLVAGPSSVCLIIRENDIRIAVPVDKVDKVIKLREMDIDPVRAEGHTVLSGVGKYQGTLVSLINVEKLLSL
jgi:chemotaxis signal transduction protein